MTTAPSPLPLQLVYISRADDNPDDDGSKTWRYMLKRLRIVNQHVINSSGLLPTCDDVDVAIFRPVPDLLMKYSLKFHKQVDTVLSDMIRGIRSITLEQLVLHGDALDVMVIYLFEVKDKFDEWILLHRPYYLLSHIALPEHFPREEYESSKMAWAKAKEAHVTIVSPPALPPKRSRKRKVGVS